MDNITGKLGDVFKMVLLSGGPRRRGAEQGLCQGLVICEKGKFTTLQEKTETADGVVGCQEFSVEGDLDSAEESFLEKKSRGTRHLTETLLKDSTHMRVRCIYSQRNSCPGSGGVRTGTETRRSLVS